MKSWHYVYSGLRVVSEQPIPEWSRFVSSDALPHADVTISFVSALDEEHATKHVLPFVSAEEYRFYVAEVGVYRVLEGRKIVVILEPGANQAEIRLFLLGSAWGALCYQRGLLVLHASAVRVDGEAVASCAVSRTIDRRSCAGTITTERYLFA